MMHFRASFPNHCSCMILGDNSDSEESSNWLRGRFLDDSPFAINSKMQSLHNHMPLFLGIFYNPYAMMNLDVWHAFRCIRGRVASFREVTCTKLQCFKLYMTYNFHFKCLTLINHIS